MVSISKRYIHVYTHTHTQINRQWMVYCALFLLVVGSICTQQSHWTQSWDSHSLTCLFPFLLTFITKLSLQSSTEICQAWDYASLIQHLEVMTIPRSRLLCEMLSGGRKDRTKERRNEGTKEGRASISMIENIHRAFTNSHLLFVRKSIFLSPQSLKR